MGKSLDYYPLWANLWTIERNETSTDVDRSYKGKDESKLSTIVSYRKR